MKKFRNILLCFLLLLIGLFVYQEPVYAKVCDAEECASCFYDGENTTYKYTVKYDLKRYSDGRVEGTFSSERDVNVTVENKITDYSFFIDNTTKKLTCPNIYVDSKINVIDTACKVTGLFGTLVGCNDKDMWTFRIYDKPGVDFGSDVLFGVFSLFRDEVGSDSVGVDSDSIEYSCYYRGKMHGKVFRFHKTKGTYNTDGGWIVYYPNGTTVTFTDNEYITKTFPSAACEDIFYSSSDNSIKVVDANSEYAGYYVSQHCNTYDDLEQFCSEGACKIEDAMCGNYFNDENSTGEYGDCPKELHPIIFFIKKVVFSILQIFVPILLILMGTIDLVKAVASSDDKGNKEAISKFIRRALAAIFCFFIVTIVTIVMDMFAKTDIGQQNDWKACWYNVD